MIIGIVETFFKLFLKKSDFFCDFSGGLYKSGYSRGLNLQEAILSGRKEKDAMAKENLRPLEAIAQALELIVLCLRELQAAADVKAAESQVDVRSDA